MSRIIDGNIDEQMDADGSIEKLPIDAMGEMRAVKGVGRNTMDKCLVKHTGTIPSTGVVGRRLVYLPTKNKLSKRS